MHGLQVKPMRQVKRNMCGKDNWKISKVNCPRTASLEQVRTFEYAALASLTNTMPYPRQTAALQKRQIRQ